MSARYRWREADGDISAPVSALETAIDQSAIQFLSSSECENVINALWRGQLVARYGTNDDVEYVPYSKDGSGSFRDHLSVHRLQVPRYQNVSFQSWSRRCIPDRSFRSHSFSRPAPGCSSCSSILRLFKVLLIAKILPGCRLSNGSCTSWQYLSFLMVSSATPIDRHGFFANTKVLRH
jgi:hypothetical protein